jgi:hypothetical protein
MFFNSFLYFPKLPDYGVPFLHYFPRFVWNIVGALEGFDKKTHIDIGNVPMMARNDVGGTSLKNMQHWIQMVRSGNFA